MSNFTVRFYQEKIQMGYLSEQAGHPVFEDRDFIQINIPGDMSNIIEREATEIDRTQFASLFAAYKQGLEPSIDGMPVEQWSKLTKAQAANYKAQNFQTVEQIAEMSDHACGSVGMGATSDRAAAKAFLALAKDAGLAQKQALIIDRQNTDIEELKRQVAELSALGLKANKTLGLPAKASSDDLIIPKSECFKCGKLTNYNQSTHGVSCEDCYKKYQPRQIKQSESIAKG